MYKDFWFLFIHGYGHVRRSVAVGAITVVASVLEGVNIGLLVPLLETLDSSSSSNEHWISRITEDALGLVGLPYTLEAILFALGVMVVLVGALKYIRLVMAARLRVGFMFWLRSQTMKNLLKTDIAYFHREKMGDIVDTLNSQSERGGATLFAMTEIFALFWLILAYGAAAFVVSPLLTAVALGLVLVVTFTIQPHIRRASRIGSSLVQRNHDLQTSSMESLLGIRTIQYFMLERIRGQHFDEAADSVSDAHYQQDLNRTQSVLIQETFLFALVGTIVYLGVAVLSLEFTLIIAVLFILYRMAPRITTLNMFRQAIAANMPAISAIKAIMDETSRPVIVSGTKDFVELKVGIELRQVRFAYQTENPVLENANFTIEKGQITALIGISGAGKSTLVDLILRFHDPVGGNILVDGVDLKEFTLESWRKSIGVVNQDIFLFNDSIFNNISMGLPDASKEQVVEAATGAFADEFIRQLPHGYDTPVGERGWNLSGGQRQRIALARAILRKPQILVLDEATSSLDAESEQLIQQYISDIRGKSTVIIVAHRLSTIETADKIVVLEDGRITDEGDWDSLLAKDAKFANYLQLQTGAAFPTEAASADANG
jgi:ABC-type multidrug transport system fused ATPase/permease subunit